MPDTARHTTAASEFTELVCADADWLRAEFDAIMAANFGILPPSAPRLRPGWTGPQRPSWPPSAPSVAGGRFSGVLPAARGGRWPRSPPRTGYVPVFTPTVTSKGGGCRTGNRGTPVPLFR